MGVEFVGVESAPCSPRRFSLFIDHINRQSKGLLVEVLESKIPKFGTGANRMDPCAFGSPMATLAGERSTFESTLSSSLNSSSSVRFGASAGSSSLSSTDAGYVNRTVSVSELLAFHKKDVKASDKQTPIVFKDFIPLTSSFPTLKSASGFTTINSSTIPAISNIPPRVASCGPSPLVDGRKSSTSVLKDSKCTTYCSVYTTGVTPSTSCSSSGPFVFSAGVSDIGPLKPGIQTNVFPSHFFSGLRPASQSNVSTDRLFSGKSRPGGQPDIPSDDSLLGPMRVACPRNASSDASFLGSPEPSVQLNVLSGNFSVPAGRAVPVSCPTAPSLVGTLKPSSQAKVSFEMQATGFNDPTGQSAISLEHLLSFNAAQEGVGGSSKCSMQRSTFAETDQGSSANISRKLNQMDIDRGIHLFRKMKKLGLDKDIEKIVEPTAPDTEVECALENWDIGKDDSLPLKMEKLAVNIEGEDPFPAKNTFIFGSQSTSTFRDWTPSSATFISGAASARVRHFPECTGNERSNPPPATNTSFFKFGAEPELEPGVTKVKMGRIHHRPFRSFHRSRGKKSASTTSSDRSGATPSASSGSISMDTHLDHPDFSKSPIPESNEGDSEKLMGRAFGGESMNSMSELEACIEEIRAAVSEFHFGAGFCRENKNSRAVPLSNVLKRNSWLDGNLFCEGVPISAAQGWEATSTANTQSVDRAENENYLADESDPMNEVNDREDEENFIAKNSVTVRKEDDTENSSGPQSCNVTDDGQPSAEGEKKSSLFTFTASPIGIPMSNLRRRTHKAHKSLGRVSQGAEASAPVFLRDRCNSKSLSAVKSDTRSGTASLGGSVGSGHREGMKAPGVVVRGVGAAVAEQVCERWRLRGNQAYAKGDFVKAEEFYSLGAGCVSPHETSQSCIRASMLCYSNRAATRMVAGRMREALADCRYAMAVDPSFFRVHLRAAGCHLALGEPELAATAFEECLRQAQGAYQVDSKILADASEGLKKSQQVAECLTQVRNLLQNNSSRDSLSALQLLNEALLSSPQSEWLLERKACMLISLQRFSEAVDVCNQSFALAERNFPTLDRNRYVNSPLGWRRRTTVKANFHLGKLEEALEQLKQLEERPSSTFSSNSDLLGAFSMEMTLPSTDLIRDLLHHKLEGNKAFQAGKFTEALDHYNAALARNGESRPFCAVCLCNRAAASQALGQIADAIADCSRAIALDPRYAKAISRRASLHEKVRDYGQSSCDLGRLIVIYESQHPQLQGVRSPRVDGSAGSTSRNEEELQQVKGRLMKAEEEMKKRIPLDHYSILGLQLGCSASEIRKAYRKSALRHHPDKAGQFLMRSGDTGDDPLKDTVDGSVRKDGERLIDAVLKDSEQLFKLIGEAYAVLSDPVKRSRYDSEEDLRKLRTISSDSSKSVYSDQNHAWTNDGTNFQAKGGWRTSNSASEPESRSRASRQRDRWEGFNHQYQRWHPGPDAAQPDVYARRGRSTGPTYGSFHRNTSWRWEENPGDGF